MTEESRTEQSVCEAKDMYDGAASIIYRDIWGENLHLGLFEHPGQPLPEAMERTTREMARGVEPGVGQRVFEAACGYGATARYLAGTFGCSVLATNISETQLAQGEELTTQRGLSHLIDYEYADFHDLPYEDGSFDLYWCQESFLHGCPKERVLSEAHRVLKPGGKLVFTEVLTRKSAPESVRQKLLERVRCESMWDAPDYRETLTDLGFNILRFEDWSENVARTYDWVRQELERRREEFEGKVGAEMVDLTLDRLAFWVDSAEQGYVGWIYVVAEK